MFVRHDAFQLWSDVLRRFGITKSCWHNKWITGISFPTKWMMNSWLFINEDDLCICVCRDSKGVNHTQNTQLKDYWKATIRELSGRGERRFERSSDWERERVASARDDTQPPNTHHVTKAELRTSATLRTRVRKVVTTRRWNKHAFTYSWGRLERALNQTASLNLRYSD